MKNVLLKRLIDLIIFNAKVTKNGKIGKQNSYYEKNNIYLESEFTRIVDQFYGEWSDVSQSKFKIIQGVKYLWTLKGSIKNSHSFIYSV